MEICSLPDKESRIVILRETLWAVRKQFTEIRKTVGKQNENVSTEIEVIKNKQTNSIAEEYKEWNKRCNKEHQEQI